MLFPGMEIVAVHPFRVTRDLDLDLEIDAADDLLAAIESILRQRERSPEAVRLEMHGSTPKAVRSLIEEELRVDPVDVYVTRSLLGMADLMELTKLDRPDLKYEPWAGVTQSRLQPVASGIRDIFSVIADGDVLVHHPYDAFSTSVEQFVSQASRDPAVLAIKQTLYRTSGEDSRIVRALVRAAESGKQTVALVELTARFDEEVNISWARVLEQAGVHVVYGVVGLKTHAKMLARRPGGGRRDPSVLPHRDRELPLGDGQALRGRRAADRRPRHHGGRGRPLQLPDRLQPPAGLPQDPGGSDHTSAHASTR